MHKGTLMNETGNIELFRVSEETKKRVADESKRIQDHMTRLNYLSRKKFHRDENEKCKRHENARKNMLQRWDIKTKNSPFRVDLVEKEEARMSRWESRAYRKQLEDDKNMTIDSMIGTKAFDVANKETVEKLFQQEQEVQLALALRKHVSDKGVVRRERSTLDQMRDMEFTELRRQFPHIGLNGDLPFRTAGGSSKRSGGERISGDNYSAVSSSNSSVKDSRRGERTDSPTEEPSRRNSFVSRAETYNSQESGSGSAYRPPTFDPSDFDRELEADFPV